MRLTTVGAVWSLALGVLGESPGERTDEIFRPPENDDANNKFEFDTTPSVTSNSTAFSKASHEFY
jgi:hypothetical protein